MKIMLIFPPQGQPFLPHPATAILTAVLKRDGHDVIQRDYNIEAYESFLCPDSLAAAGISPITAAQSQKARQRIRQAGEFLEPDAYWQDILTIENCLGAVSGRRWGLKHLRMPPYRENFSSDIILAARDEERNFLIPFLREKAEEIARIAPGMLGISISWPSQLIPAFTLARLVKERMPSIHVCMGGSLVSRLSGQMAGCPGLFPFADTFVPFEGEAPLLALCQGLQTGSLQEVPGIICRERENIRQNPPPPPTPLASLPLPCYDGLPLSLYYSPGPYLPISASRGCYWGRCTFCTHHGPGTPFRQRSPEAIAEEMETMEQAHGCKNFYFVDDCLPPALAGKLAERLAGRGFRWGGEIRLERGLDAPYFRTLHRGGCRLLLFGLESACLRILELMNKGINPGEAAGIIKAADGEGIITWVFFFLGFPGERRHEARLTLKYLIENRDHIDVIAGGTFTLTRGSTVERQPERFALGGIGKEGMGDLQLSFPFTTREGLQAPEAARLTEEFKRKDEARKFLLPFVAEPHVLFFRKSHFAVEGKRG